MQIPWDNSHYSNGNKGTSHRDHIYIPWISWANLLEVIEAASIFTPYILHPIRGLNTVFPEMGATSFNPNSSIADLAGKVILVTGG